MPRAVQSVALTLAFLLVGGPAVIAELVEDDCAEACEAEQPDESCPEEGCTDCSILCSGCGRTPVITAAGAIRLALAGTGYVQLVTDVGQRMPAGPPPQGVFHPPRVAG